MCMSCNKSSKVNTNIQRSTSAAPIRIGSRPVVVNRVNNTFGQPKVKISFSSRNRG